MINHWPEWERNKELADALKVANKRIEFMTILLEEKEDEEVKKDNVINLEEAVKTRKATGGTGETVDWLSPLRINAVFWAKQRRDTTSFILTQYQVVFKGNKARSLKVTLNSYMDRPDECVVINVAPMAFCEMNSLFEIIKKGDDE